ncbi:MAG: CCA tRNA nucleotidyltransferase, partial [Vulcanococcus sp.]
PWSWCQRLEAPGLSPEAVALALACGLGPRRPLLRWLLRWRHLGPEQTSQALIAAGVPPGPGLGERLRRSRRERLERERP